MLKAIFISILLVSCSTVQEVIRPYRINAGFATRTADFKDKDSERRVCVESSPDGNSKSCGNGFENYKKNTTYDIGYETRPYFYKSDWDWASRFASSLFVTYSSVNTTLIDYPIQGSGERTNVRVSRYAINPILFYNFGDKYFKNMKGMNLRLGVGLSINYLNTLEVTRLSTGEKVSKDNDIDTGLSMLIEFNWDWFYMRVAHSNVGANVGSFSGLAEKNELEISQNTVALGVAYYFDELEWYDNLWK